MMSTNVLVMQCQFQDEMVAETQHEWYQSNCKAFNYAVAESKNECCKLPMDITSITMMPNVGTQAGGYCSAHLEGCQWMLEACAQFCPRYPGQIFPTHLYRPNNTYVKMQEQHVK